ncbi:MULTISPECIES: TadE family type IV pilus minor pilin [unclassified Modestobacter]|uniref:TadE family type IV pilus minor pilin n=1 Tax=unclassified Modestobacter TaxID=2643866 RepID=UPI0022AA126E|nr:MULTISPECIES: TadE family type IV pilus minor pilin [unclassified Modestobacter]MCZ2825362.1 pilus assembly protein [Modestobacter sp. VKM Ac-2981]MCZ2853573.1 pilus assembly protein [Modestobacter sp. VKM Ac-2982]
MSTADRGRRAGVSREAGMVTAETAVVLPVLLLVLAAAVSAVVVVGAQLRCVDAAREGARAAARGEPVALVHELAAQAAPDGATTELDLGETVRVTVAATVEPLGPLPWRVEVTATATGLREPAAGGSP